VNDLQTIDRTEMSIQKVLDRLERWEKRFEGHCAQKRDCVRQQFRGKVTVYIPSVTCDLSEITNSDHINVWTRNISQSGICFVATELITAAHVVLCLRFSEENTAYFRAALVRRRQVAESMWEYGVEFRERIDPSSNDATKSDSAQKPDQPSVVTPEVDSEAEMGMATPENVNDDSTLSNAEPVSNDHNANATTDPSESPNP